MPTPDAALTEVAKGGPVLVSFVVVVFAILGGVFVLVRWTLEHVLKPSAEAAIKSVTELNDTMKDIRAHLRLADQESSRRHEAHALEAHEQHAAIRDLVVDAGRRVEDKIDVLATSINEALGGLRDALRDTRPGERFPTQGITAHKPVLPTVRSSK